MSKTIYGVYQANPITSNANTDLLYIGSNASGGSGVDAAITYANFAAQFSGPSPLTTKGDLYTFSTVNTRIAVGSTNGQILQVSSGAATGLAWSTAAYPTVATSTGSFIYANGTNFVASTSLWPNTVGSNGLFLISNGTSNVYSTSTIPTSAGATVGKVLSSDGTNYVLSTATFPVASATAGKIIISDGTNWVASTPTYPTSAASTGSFIYANGTNFVASTSLWPNTVGTAGKIIRSDGTTNTYTTSTFADTYAVSTILYASGANAVSGLATANSASLVTNSTGVPVWSGTMTNGQVIIGSTGATPTAGTLTAGTGISITNAAASITVASNGAQPWVDQTTASVTMAVNTGYTSDAGASLVTFTLPATSAIGDWVEINGKGSGLWTIAQASGQQIHINASATTSGATGTLSSTGQFDNVRLRCLTANTIWTVVSQQSAGLTVV